MIADDIKIEQDFRPDGYVFKKDAREPVFNSGGVIPILSYVSAMSQFVPQLKVHFMGLGINSDVVDEVVKHFTEDFGDCSQLSGRARLSLYHGVRREISSKGWSVSSSSPDGSLKPFFV